MAKVVIYTTQWCGYCMRAKALLKRKNIPFEEIDVTDDFAMRDKLVGMANGRTTVPQIFIDGQSIGGSDELTVLDKQGALEALAAR